METKVEAILTGVENVKDYPDLKRYTILVKGKKNTMTVVGDASLNVPEDSSKVLVTINFNVFTYKVESNGKEYDRQAFKGFIANIEAL